MKSDDSWKLKFKRLPHLDGLQLLHISDVTHEYPRHVHEEYCVATILRGSETHISRGNSYTAFAGDMLLLNAEEAHSNRSVDVEYKSIQFTPSLFRRLFGDSEGGKLPLFVHPLVTDPELFATFLNLYSTLDDQELSPLEQESEFVLALDLLLNKSLEYASVVETRSVKDVRAYLRSHYSENVSLSSLASIANVSPFHLVRVFKNEVGVPPHEYQTQIRITNAQRLMRAGYSITDAAIETGFFDQSHFSRNFKRITGLTPGRYISHSNIVQDN